MNIKCTNLLLQTEAHGCKPTHTGQSPTFLVLVHFKHMPCRRMFQRQFADPTHTHAHTHTRFCVHCMLSYKLLRDNIVLAKISSITHHLGCCTIQEAGYRSRNYIRQTTRRYLLTYVDPLYQISSESVGLLRELKQAYEMTNVTSALCAHFTQFL